MAIYKAPVRDMQFVLHELLDAESEFQTLGFDEASADVVDAILEEGAKFCESVIFPTNRVGDQEGCKFDNGIVTTPAGFREAYNALCEGGWMSLACDAEYGGQGLPNTLSVFFEEMLQSANMAFSLYPGLTRGAYVAITAHGSKEIKQRYLPKMVEGTWSGAMALTESHCGTDLGLLRTRAEPQKDGSYHLAGTKIFITGGEHDLAENIIHLVLARLSDAPQGSKGISMFLVPKFLVNEDGSLGERNGMSCGSIEHKMGIKGASTCVMNYENAKGWLVGEPNRGLHAMFSMMNHE
ncbi:MAG: acyl-CoA dehydrogenase family protein, partial [Gammaproteobacteria bacterium]|nr:acyl-CoA dehydrogenase family protein [Gammaproteobacteria bacterium]